MRSGKLLLVAAVAVTLAVSAGPAFAWHISNTTTGYRDASGAFVATTTVPLGEDAVDSATVDPVVGCSTSTACGYVVFQLFGNGNCGGTASASDSVTVTSPIASGSTETVYTDGFTVTSGSWSFLATWHFNDGSSGTYQYPSCEPFNVPNSTPEFPLGMAALLLVALPALLFLRKRQLAFSP